MANSVGASGHLLSGAKVVTTAGTAVALEDGTVDLVRGLTIIALSTNTGRIFLGGADVDSSTNVGLNPGDALNLNGPNGLKLSDTYIDAAVNGEGVDFYGVK